MFNTLRTTVLLAALTGLFMAVGFVIGGTGGMIMAFGFAIATNAFAFWNSDKMVLRMQNAREVDHRSAPDLYDMVARLSQNAELPMPKVYVLETDQPNAFATGRDPENAAVAVSTGLLRMLEQREVAGVVAHELAHIKNRDTLTMTITATLAGAISMLAQFGFFFGGRSSNNSVGPLGGIAMMILAPMAAMMVQMAVSRTREYEADHDGAVICGDPLALASALAKISGTAERVQNPAAQRSPGMAHMFIVNPLAGNMSLRNLFSTHPDVNKRISELEKLSTRMGEHSRTMNESVVTRRNADYNAAQTRTRQHRTTARNGWRVPTSRSNKDQEDRKSDRRGPWG